MWTLESRSRADGQHTFWKYLLVSSRSAFLKCFSLPMYFSAWVFPCALWSMRIPIHVHSDRWHFSSWAFPWASVVGSFHAHSNRCAYRSMRIPLRALWVLGLSMYLGIGLFHVLLYYPLHVFLVIGSFLLWSWGLPLLWYYLMCFYTRKADLLNIGV